MSKSIPIHNRQRQIIAYALVDDEDYAWLSQWPWSVVVGYAVHAVRNPKGKPRQKMIKMHRLITGAQEGQIVDHRNHNKLDNRRANLRLCSITESHRNRRKFVRSRFNTTPSSIFKGVHWRAARNRWEAGIRVDGKQIYLGRYRTEIEAAQAYDEGARKYHGEFARTNF